MKRCISQKEHSWKGSGEESESSNELECQQRLCLFAASGRTEEVGLKAEADTGGDDLSADDVKPLLKPQQQHGGVNASIFTQCAHLLSAAREHWKTKLLFADIAAIRSHGTCDSRVEGGGIDGGEGLRITLSFFILMEM